ncbi:MAG: spore protease YyaC [Tissierellia bacterium]|nr:spore protease YyaC [Tissierellia bacterium]MDD4779473.1 spore protease YyaC [Tissierellia bacterium]
MDSVEVNYKNSLASLKIGYYLADYLTEDSAIVCIGTDKCIIDSLGPLIGTMLSRKNVSIDIYGTLEKPVHAMNLTDYIKNIKSKNYKNILAIDACLSTKKVQGAIEVRSGPINPGKGIGKFLPEVGNVSIIGIVESSEKEFKELIQDTRLSLIYEMAEVITEGILISININESKDEYEGNELVSSTITT